MSEHGHFGLSSVRIAAGALGAVLLHFLLPYGVVQFRGPASPGMDWLTRGDVIANAQPYAGRMLGAASPNLVLAGLIVALAAAALLLFLGFQPLSVVAARWAGAACSTVAAIGFGLAWMGSMYSVGTTFSTLLGTIFPTKYVAYFWALSPFFIAAISGWLIIECMMVARAVVATRDGLRAETDGALRLGAAGMAFLGLVLLVPWSIGLVPDGVSDSLGVPAIGDDKAALWLSAEDVQSVTPAEAHPDGRARYFQDDDFNFLSSAISVMVAAGWVFFAGGWLRALMATASSAGAPLRLTVGARFIMAPAMLLLLAAMIMYVLAWIFVKPNPDVADTFLPGFWPIAVVFGFYYLAKTSLPTLRMLAPEPVNITPVE